MMARRWPLTVGLVAVGIAAGTWVVGWPAVIVVAALAVAVDRSAWVAVRAAIGATLGWSVLLAYDAAQGPAGTFIRLMGQLLPIGGAGFVLLTLLFAALLAWSTARLVRGLAVR